MSIAKKRLGPDLASLLARSISKVRKRKVSERLWSAGELANVHDQIAEEIWRTSWW